MSETMKQKPKFYPNHHKQSSNFVHTQTSNNVLASMKPRSFKNQMVCEDISFELNLEEQHSAAIWESSLQFLSQSLQCEFNKQKGFNDQNIFPILLSLADCNENSIEGKADIFQQINRNQLLTTESNQFICDLEVEKNLKSLIESIRLKFNEEVFNQITLVCYKAWEKYLKFKDSTKIKPEVLQFTNPRFADLSLAGESKDNKKMHFLELTDQEIIESANCAAKEIAGLYFVNTKIKMINLKELNKDIEVSPATQKEFNKFIEAIVQATFLCVEGCFCQPKQAFQSHSCLNLELSEQEEEEHLKGRKMKK